MRVKINGPRSGYTQRMNKNDKKEDVVVVFPAWRYRASADIDC